MSPRRGALPWLVLLAACANEPAAPPPPPAPTGPATGADALVPLDAPRLLRRISLDLLGRLPDEMELDLSGETLVLRLFDGTTMRGGEKAPFLDGTMRIVVPRVDAATWSAAALPGIVAEPAVGEG